MFKAIKKTLKDQRGLTLVELLAVVVILGIISAIAVPSIGGLIDNSKKDAHVANAQQMVNAAKLAITADQSLLEESNKFLTLNYLTTEKYLDDIKDPDDNNYNKGTATTVVKAKPAEGSYVVVNKGKVVSVKLVNGKRGVQTATGNFVEVEKLSRSSVENNPASSN